MHHLTCVHIIFSSVSVAEWPPFWKELPTRLFVGSLCILTFGFEGGVWVLIAPTPGHCILVTFIIHSLTMVP